MKVKIPYGKDEEQELIVPDENFAGIIYPNDVKIGDERKEIKRALAEPIGSPTVGEIPRRRKGHKCS